MAISIVQTATGVGNPPVAFASPVTVGNTVILIAPTYSTSGTQPSTSAVKLGGNTITGTVAFFNPGINNGVNSTTGTGNVAYVSIWMLPNVQVSGQTAVDVTNSGGGIGQVAYEVAGLGTSPSLDQSASGSSTSSSSLTTGATGAITGAPEIVIGASMTFGGAGAPAGFTAVNPTTDLWAGYQIASSVGATYTWSQSAAGTPWAAGLVTILATPSAGLMPPVWKTAPVYQPRTR